MATPREKCLQFLEENRIDMDTVIDVKPDDCGTVDGSWLVGQMADGRWFAMTDEADQDVQIFATEEEALAAFEGAAEAERSTRN